MWWLRNLTATAFIGIGGMAGAGSSYAATLISCSLPTAGCALGIDGLTVDGVTYNVTFSHAAYGSVYAITPPTFWGNEPAAKVAATILAAALTDLGVSELAATDPTQGELALVPFSAGGDVS